MLIVSIAGLVYWFHWYDIKTREEARQKVEKDLAISAEKVNDAFQYIALANRRLPLLGHVTTDLLARSTGTANSKKDIFHELLALAVVSLSRTEYGIFRFVEVSTGRTVKEFIFTVKDTAPPRVPISNRVLLEMKSSRGESNTLHSLCVLSTTHHGAPVRCHYIFLSGPHLAKESLSVLQSIVDQTQVLYKYLYQ